MYVENRYFELVDTGGMGIEDGDNLTDDIEQQIATALESASVVLFVVDSRGRRGAARSGRLQAAALRRRADPVRGQQDRAPSMDDLADDFYRLGRGKIVAVSAQGESRQGRNCST